MLAESENASTKNFSSFVSLCEGGGHTSGILVLWFQIMFSVDYLKQENHVEMDWKQEASIFILCPFLELSDAIALLPCFRLCTS